MGRLRVNPTRLLMNIHSALGPLSAGPDREEPRYHVRTSEHGISRLAAIVDPLRRETSWPTDSMITVSQSANSELVIIGNHGQLSHHRTVSCTADSCSMSCSLLRFLSHQEDKEKVSLSTASLTASRSTHRTLPKPPPGECTP